MHIDDDETPAHLRQLDARAVHNLVSKLATLPLGFTFKAERDAFAETRTIHDARRLLKYMQHLDRSGHPLADHRNFRTDITDLEVILANGR
jgi:hypothetical protein